MNIQKFNDTFVQRVASTNPPESNPIPHLPDTHSEPLPSIMERYVVVRRSLFIALQKQIETLESALNNSD